MGDEDLAWHHGGLGTHWTVRVVAGVSGGIPSMPSGAGLLNAARPLLAPSVGVGAQQLEIRNLDTGTVGTFTLTDVNVGIGIGIGGSAGSGTAAYFETEEPTTMRDFEGVARVTTVQVGSISAHAGLVLPVDVKHDSFWEQAWRGDGVDISATANSVGLGLSWGVGDLVLVDISPGEPDSSLVDVMRSAIDAFFDSHGVADSDHDMVADTCIAPVPSAPTSATAASDVDDPEDGGLTSDLDDPEDGGLTSDLDDPEDGGLTSGLDDPEDGGLTSDADDPEDGGLTSDADDPEDGGLTSDLDEAGDDGTVIDQ